MNINAVSQLLEIDAADADAVTSGFADIFGTALTSYLTTTGELLPVAAALAADFDVDNQTTGATPTATSLAVPVKASRSYIVEATLYCTATTNGGIEVSFTGPASATAVLQANIFQAVDNVVNDGEMDLAGAVNYIAAALSFDVMTITGVLTVSTTAGTFTIRGAQDTAHADNTIIHAGSFVKLTPVI